MFQRLGGVACPNAFPQRAEPARVCTSRALRGGSVNPPRRRPTQVSNSLTCSLIRLCSRVFGAPRSGAGTEVADSA